MKSRRSPGTRIEGGSKCPLDVVTLTSGKPAGPKPTSRASAHDGPAATPRDRRSRGRPGRPASCSPPRLEHWGSLSGQPRRATPANESSVHNHWKGLTEMTAYLTSAAQDYL